MKYSVFDARLNYLCYIDLPKRGHEHLDPYVTVAEPNSYRMVAFRWEPLRNPYVNTWMLVDEFNQAESYVKAAKRKALEGKG